MLSFTLTYNGIQFSGSDDENCSYLPEHCDLCGEVDVKYAVHWKLTTDQASQQRRIVLAAIVIVLHMGSSYAVKSRIVVSA